MDELTEKTEEIMMKRFGKDSIISLATAKNNIPYVRSVNAYYKDRAFYIITYALSNKMDQIRNNPICAISGDWFTASGEGVNLGWFNRSENTEIAKELRMAFKDWIDNGHNNFNDENCIILKIELQNGVLFSQGTRYDIIFKNSKIKSRT